MERYILILCTTPSLDVSEKIGKMLIENKLAACCNILPDLKSIYRWQNQVESSTEQLLFIKSTEENYKAIEDSILDIHPYETPEIISVNITDGYKKYLTWITENTRAPND